MINDDEVFEYLYERFGEIQPCLQAVIDGLPCADTLCKSITIEVNPLLGMPNAFTPNGDGLNDTAYVEGRHIADLSYGIYNRWGELVFESNDINLGWDGRFRGIYEQEVYVYVVEARFIDNSRQSIARKSNLDSMNKWLYITGLVIVCLGHSLVMAQDVHFTSTFQAPCTESSIHRILSPETIELESIIKNSGRGQSNRNSSPYNTSSAFAEWRIRGRKRKKKDWFGLGLITLHDVAGDGKLLALTRIWSLHSLSPAARPRRKAFCIRWI